VALSSAQKTKILRLLGWPYGTLVSTSLDYSNIVKRQLDGISGDAQTEVESLLTRLDTIDTQLDAKLKQAGIKRLDDIEFYQDSHKVLKSEKNRVLIDLATLIGIPMRSCGANGNVVV